MKQKRVKKFGGFTLVEVTMAVFLFSVIMAIVMSVMVNTVVVKKRIQGSAQNLEEARFAMETMAKTLRGSKIFGCNGGNTCSSGATSVETFDYSQDKCIQYSFRSDASGNKKIFSRTGVLNSDNCIFSSEYIPMVGESSKIEDMNFNVAMSDDGLVGRATIFMEICSKYNGSDDCVAGKSDNFPIQTTVSLRY